MNVTPLDAGIPFRISAGQGQTAGTPVEVRVLMAQVLLDQRRATIEADSATAAQDATKAAQQADGSGTVIDKTA